MQGQQSSQASFHAMIYEELISADHLLRRLSTAVDFSFAPTIPPCVTSAPDWDRTSPRRFSTASSHRRVRPGWCMTDCG